MMNSQPAEPTALRETVNANGVDVGYRRAGEGEPLLFLGGQGYPAVWMPFFDALSARHDLIVPEHPGFGETELPDDLLDFADLSVHYAAFLDALNVSSVHLVGHAFGGWAAAELASFFPERVRTLTLIAPAGLRPDEAEAMVDPYRLDRTKWLAQALGPDASRWVPPVDEASDWADRTLSDYKERIGVARVGWNPRYDLRLERRLGRVTAPAQVLVPEEDRLTAPSIGRRYTELLGLSGVEVVPGDGFTSQHLLIAQVPEDLARRVLGLTAQAGH